MVWKDACNAQFGRRRVEVLKRRALLEKRKPSDAKKAWQRVLESAEEKLGTLLNVDADVDDDGTKRWGGARRRCDWQSMPAGCDPSAGKLGPIRSWRKRRQIENLMGPIEFLAALCYRRLPLHRGVGRAVRLVDFCASSGFVGLPAAWVLKHLNVRVDVTDMRAMSIQLAQQRLQMCKGSSVENYVDARVELCEDHPGGFDIGIGLHACGTMTDVILDRCLSERAAFVLAPCCVGRLAQTDAYLSRPRSCTLKRILTPAQMRALSKSADCAVRDVQKLSETDKMRRRAKRIVDEDRLFLARESNYNVFRFQMKPYSCTPKNDVLVGFPREWDVQ